MMIFESELIFVVLRLVYAVEMLACAVFVFLLRRMFKRKYVREALTKILLWFIILGAARFGFALADYFYFDTASPYPIMVSIFFWFYIFTVLGRLYWRLKAEQEKELLLEERKFSDTDTQSLFDDVSRIMCEQRKKTENLSKAVSGEHEKL